jgi:epoxyqueuosine reductase
VLGRCRELGFALAGVAAAEPTRYERELRGWLAAGRHGEMRYLAERLSRRLDPRNMVPGARSVICVADRYHDGRPDPAGTAAGDPRGRIARYARGDDYHPIIKKRLHRLADELAAQLPGETFRACVDTAPVLERELAQRAGLGAVGKHTLLIEPGVGSWLLLGEIITTAQLSPSAPCEADPCSGCTRCIDACPTDAITPWSVDAARCISYLTIEHRSGIDRRFHELIGDWIFGCDVCQEVCPHNEPTERSRAAAVHQAYAPRRAGFGLLEVLGWDVQARREAFARSAMKRAKLAMMKRNALIAAGNALAEADRPALRQRVEAIADDPAEDDQVRSAARDVIARLET